MRATDCWLTSVPRASSIGSGRKVPRWPARTISCASFTGRRSFPCPGRRSAMPASARRWPISCAACWSERCARDAPRCCGNGCHACSRPRPMRGHAPRWRSPLRLRARDGRGSCAASACRTGARCPSCTRADDRKQGWYHRMMQDTTFRAALLSRLRRDWRTVQHDNVDWYRFPPALLAEEPAWRNYARRFGGQQARSLLRALRIIASSHNLQWLHERLGDATSRELMVAVLAFRALGSRHVRLPLNDAGFWDLAKKIGADLLLNQRTRQLTDGDWLDDYDLAPAGIPVRMHAHLLNVLNAFFLEQYRFARDGVVIEVEPGDYVIDAGACWGDTALYFSLRGGVAGKVWCYEFEPQNLRVLAQNLESNPGLGSRIRVVKQPLWSAPSIDLDMIGSGPNTRLVPTKDGQGSVRTDTIDSLASREGLDRVDFIKMDIEGAELHALKGAEHVIRRFRPKLAISIYHRLEDFWQIPRWIDSLGLDYRFHLDHFTIHAEETMLFAVAPRVPKPG
ncbi:MAG: FkbM family methyltransferase [Burkholderiales bacterium]|nr:MAG: FkbM family methyltransferase [Burkholderiales bacterium]